MIGVCDSPARGAGRRALFERVFFYVETALLADVLCQLARGMEGDDTAFRYRYPLAASEIARPAFRSVFRLKSAEALELHCFTGLERRAHFFEYRVHHIATLAFAQADVLEQQVLELFLRQGSFDNRAVLRRMNVGVRPIGSIDGSGSLGAAVITRFQ